MELEKFCPRCGEKTEELHGDRKKLCPDCYPEVNDLLDVPSTVEITVCPVCGRMRKSGEWIEEYSIEDQLAARFADFNEPGVRMELGFREEDEYIKVRVHASRDGMEAEYGSRAKFGKEQCPECSRFASGSYKVKLQLRGEGDLEHVSNAIVDRAAELTDRNRKNFLAGVDEDVHGGSDFYISTEDMAKEILDMLRSRYDPEIKRSYELIGEEDGQEVYRNVISVRM